MPLTSGTGRKFGIVLRFINNDVIVGEETASFNPDCSSQNDWQYLSMRVAAKTVYTSLRILLVYECNVRTPIVHHSRSRRSPTSKKSAPPAVGGALCCCYRGEKCQWRPVRDRWPAPLISLPFP